MLNWSANLPEQNGLEQPRGHDGEEIDEAVASIREYAKQLVEEGQRDARHVVDPPAPPPAGREQDVELDLVDPSPFQNRRDFDAEALTQLAATLEAHGLLQPIVVRPQGDRFELVAGERRTRAARQLGWKTIRATVRPLSDQAAAELVLVENLSRKDLGPIEEALGYQRLIEQHGYTQEAVAKRVAVSPSQVAHRLRLLELPARWLAKVEKGELSASHARALVSWAKTPAIWSKIEKELVRDLEEDPDPSLADWEYSIADAVRHATEAPTGTSYGGAGNGWKNTPWSIDTTGLQVVEVSIRERWEDKARTEQRVIPDAEFKKRKAAAITAAEKKASQPKGSKAKGGEKAAAPKLTPKQQAEHDARRKKENAEQLRKRTTEWRIDWLRELIAADLAATQLVAGGGSAARLIVRWALWCAGSGHQQQLREPLRKAAGKKSNDMDWSTFEVDNPLELARKFLVECLRTGEQHSWRAPVPPDVVEAIASEFKIDLAKAWRAARAGKLTERFYLAHTTDQLRELALRQWKIPVTEKMGKGELVERLCEGGADYLSTQELPKSIAAVKAGKGR